MAGKWVLDSTVVVDLLRGDRGIADRIQENDVAITLVVLGELLFGIKNSERTAKQLPALEAFVADCEVIELTRETCDHYGQLKVIQERIGKRIPDNDMWVAASAREHGLRVAHRDEHYEMMPDFPQERW